MHKYEIEKENRQQEDQQEVTEEAIRNEGSGTSSTTCARARARARRIVTVEDRYDIRTLYREAVGYEMQPFVEKMCVDYLLQGMEKEVVLHAIELTGWAPRPSAHYLRAILRRYEDSEIYTEGDVERDEWRRSGEQDIYRAQHERGV